MKKVSIVMAYYNRLPQLEFTLKTIEMSKYEGEIEIIIVDDASDPNMMAKQGIGGRDNIKITTISLENRWWNNPCIAFNIAFRQVSGDIVIIQNPECIHVGDVVSKAVELTND